MSTGQPSTNPDKSGPQFVGPHGEPLNPANAIIAAAFLLLAFGFVVLTARAGHPWAAGLVAGLTLFADRALFMSLWKLKIDAESPVVAPPRAPASPARVWTDEQVARELLPIFDNLERARAAAAQGPALQGFADGLRMVQDLALCVLAQCCVQPVPARGQPFDPRLHDAVMVMPSAELPPGTVGEEFERGFVIGPERRLLRPSRVAVVMRAPSDSDVAEKVQ